MEKVKVSDLGQVQRTLLVPLFCRAEESQRKGPLVRDPAAVELVEKIEGDLPDMAKLRAWDKIFTLMRAREFDRCGRAFLNKRPAGVVVDIGCGLDTRFERLDNGEMEWFGLDLPDVIALRRRLLTEKPRARLINCSALDFTWMDCIPPERSGYLFLAEGVLPYFEEKDVKRLVFSLQAHFPGSELMFDAQSPALTRLHNRELASMGLDVRLHWGVRDDRELEEWGEGIRLVKAWGYFDEQEPRLGWSRLLRWVPVVGNGARILHYRLGSTLPS